MSGCDANFSVGIILIILHNFANLSVLNMISKHCTRKCTYSSKPGLSFSSTPRCFHTTIPLLLLQQPNKWIMMNVDVGCVICDPPTRCKTSGLSRGSLVCSCWVECLWCLNLNLLNTFCSFHPKPLSSSSSTSSSQAVCSVMGQQSDGWTGRWKWH